MHFHNIITYLKGTIFCGIFGLCLGQARINVKEGKMMKSYTHYKVFDHFARPQGVSGMRDFFPNRRFVESVV
jgi:hypothetical protein